MRGFLQICENGLKIQFWYDMWCGDQTLMEAFPILYTIARFKEASVSNHILLANNIC